MWRKGKRDEGGMIQSFKDRGTKKKGTQLSQQDNVMGKDAKEM